MMREVISREQAAQECPCKEVVSWTKARSKTHDRANRILWRAFQIRVYLVLGSEVIDSPLGDASLQGKARDVFP